MIMRITTRIMGLPLEAVAMQFLLNALRELKLTPQSSRRESAEGYG
jgi:small neutral amino acid transporter SnatA (MarC family)